ncbi:DUF1801 domain-containing protein [Pedobacter chitinilyticus]|uniref:DUF1801 domain-containing protein n=1 Tax=Pedobacter chitinilyticus TaxID=2233776 RepID=A0A3S3PZP5_9SPHI|nr:DUF1801 domain-containing protein [Pedobacter chitinilyticus]RWU08380.1 DUF1801 domain-containing protein [Pedobacter chitinilyticus]
MAELKTKANNNSVSEFINALTDERKRDDSFALCEIMEEICQAKPKMWGDAIIGFGDKDLVYPDGRRIDWMVMAFSPRKQNLTLYLEGGSTHPLLSKLGKHKTSKACLYIKTLKDIDLDVLRQIITDANV